MTPSSGAAGLGRLLRTARYLDAEQVVHRARLRAERGAVSFAPQLMARAVDLRRVRSREWPADFTPIDLVAPPDVGDGVVQGTFRLLGEARNLGSPADWDQRAASRLWRFHLHYFEWAWNLARLLEPARAREAFGALWESWTAAVPFGHPDAWSPYVCSLRSWVLCGVYERLVRQTPIEDRVRASMRLHAGYLASNLELDVRGNHLVKNLKALIGLGVFFGRWDMVSGASSRLSKEVVRQVLADGGHYERSPSYHCQVLEDLLDVRSLLSSCQRPSVPGLDQAIDQMRGWLGTMTAPGGELPLMNDAVRVAAERRALLDPLPAPSRVAVLGPSGYVALRPRPGVFAVLDVGDPCPDQLPAHAHADCLSFELWVDGEKVVHDGGVSTYEPGATRLFERSTAAHNTVEVDGQDQTEVWATFRAGRRARGHLDHVRDCEEGVEVVAHHDGYGHLSGSPLHRRQWLVRPTGVRVVDSLAGDGIHVLKSRLRTTFSQLEVQIEGQGGLSMVEEGKVAVGFGLTRDVTVRTLTAHVPLPYRLSWDLRW